MTDEGDHAHWRDTMRPLTVGPFPAVTLFPLFLLALWWAMWVVWLNVICMTIGWLLHQRRWTIAVALRAIRHYVVGQHRPATSLRNSRTMSDHGSSAN